MLKIVLFGSPLLMVLALFGYWNYRQTCRSAEKLIRDLQEKP